MGYFFVDEEVLLEDFFAAFFVLPVDFLEPPDFLLLPTLPFLLLPIFFEDMPFFAPVFFAAIPFLPDDFFAPDLEAVPLPADFFAVDLPEDFVPDDLVEADLVEPLDVFVAIECLFSFLT